MNLPDTKTQYYEMLERIKRNEDVRFMRWGDGEWQCLLGWDGQNTDGHRYFRSLRLALHNVLKNHSDRHIFAMQPKTMRDMGKEVEMYLASHNISIPWQNSDIFHDASTRDLLKDFWPIIQDRECIVVGKESLLMLQVKLRNMRHIVVPICDAWLDRDRIDEELISMISKSKTLNPVVFISCGPLANPLIYNMPYFEPIKPIILNMGSLFDPYCGLVTRRYHGDIITKLGGA